MSNKQNPWAKATVEKARGPMGGRIVPEKFNGTAPSSNIGGWEDASARRSASMSNTARDGAGSGAAQTDAGPTQSPPTPAPNGRDKGNRRNPWAPRSLSEVARAKGPRQGPRASSQASSMTGLARGGGAKLPLSPDRHQQPALPEPRPSFPKAAAPRGGKPVPAPPSSGNMSGMMQGGSGVMPGRSDLSST
jgi:hypothetical protein